MFTALARTIPRLRDYFLYDMSVRLVFISGTRFRSSAHWKRLLFRKNSYDFYAIDTGN